MTPSSLSLPLKLTDDATGYASDRLPIRYLSVCSGIEAATVAWHPLGWMPAAFSEIEAFPRAVLAHRYPDVPLHGDFTTIRGGEYGPVSLLVGGTPCQSFSVAGLRKGLADDRGNLALQFLALARRTGARWVLWENVPGVLSSNGGRDFGAFLGGLAELGYGFAYRVLDAQHFGVPQRRRRVFVVGHLGDWRRAAAVFFERHSLQGHPAPRRDAGERVAGPFSAGAHPGGYNGQDASNDLLITHSLRADGFDASEDGTERGTPLVADTVRSHPRPGSNSVGGIAFGWQNSPSQGASAGVTPTLDKSKTPAIAFSSKDHGADAGDLAPTLRAMGHDGSHANAGGQVAVAFHDNQRHELTTSDTAGALKSGGGKPGQGYPAAMQGSSVRRLTPRECERLQGFPDDWTQVPYRGKPAADGPRYKAIGNSMAVPVMAWLGRRIAQIESLFPVRVAFEQMADATAGDTAPPMRVAEDCRRGGVDSLAPLGGIFSSVDTSVRLGGSSLT